MLPSVELTALEKSAVELIKSALRANELPDDPLFFRRTEKYLTVGGNDYLPFVRLKLNKDLWYIAIRCGDSETDKSYLRLTISDVSEIEKYSNKIAEAFRFSRIDHADTPPAVWRTADISGIELSPEMQEFFSKMEVPLDSKQKLNHSEITFFTAYVEKLKAAGLNWRNAEPARTADGFIRARGGSVRLRTKKTQFMYWPTAAPDAIFEGGLTLEECISKLDYWIKDCLRNRDTYDM